MMLFIFLSMLFCHIVDDYYLQGILANMKQKSWWHQQTRWDPKYKKDWIPALIAHGVSWSFMMTLPCNIYLLINKPNSVYLFSLIFIWNVFGHCRIDHAKCNDHVINLVADQALHMLQIILTFGYFLIVAL